MVLHALNKRHKGKGEKYMWLSRVSVHCVCGLSDSCHSHSELISPNSPARGITLFVIPFA